MAALEPGSRAYVHYVGDMWHERLILAWIDAAEYVICTPDGGIFIEQLDGNNLELVELRFCPVGGGLPYGLGAQPRYEFHVRPAGAELASLLSFGALHAATEQVDRGLPWAVSGAAHVGAAGAPVAVPLPLLVALALGVPSTNLSVWVLKVIYRSLHIAATADALNLRVLPTLEYPDRRRLRLEDAHQDFADMPNFEGAQHYLV